MAGFGYESVMDMAWTLARDFTAVVFQERHNRWLEMAAAMRVAGANQKDWERIVNSYEP